MKTMTKEKVKKQGCRVYYPIILLVSLAFLQLQAFAQVTFTGKVSATSGEPIPGATVVIKGTTTGTVTDANGNFTFQAKEGDNLVVSFVGMKSREIPFTGQRQLEILLDQDIIGLEEVIAVGYGTMKKSDLTGAAVSANIEAFRESPNVNILQSLQGSVPGVQIGQITQAGQEPSIEIRGLSTISGNTDPLIVVDGIMYRGRIGDLNPGDIQSVDILKDASSKAIYGAQAANGVILITTKRGKITKKPIISYSGSFSTHNPVKKVRLFNREETMSKIKNIFYRNAFLAPDYVTPNPDWDFSQTDILPVLIEGISKGYDFDWWDALTSPGFLMNHQLNLAGGAEKIRYYLSGGYTDQEGLVMNDNYKRTTIRINIDADITKWLTIGTNTMGSFADYSGYYPSIGDISVANPLARPKDENNEFIVNHLRDNRVNPFLDAQADDRELKNRIFGVFYGEIRIPKLKGLTYRLNYSNNLNWFSNFNSNIYSAGLTGAASKAHASQLDVMIDNILTYKRQFKEHGVMATLVSGFNKVEYNRTYAGGNNIPNLALSFNSLEQAIIQNISSSAWQETAIYQMGRLNYNFKSKYLVTATIRRDGFSGFAKNNKFAMFPSLGVAWVITDEPFFQVPKIDYLKLRASYGLNGNQTARYSSLARISAADDSKYVFGDGASTAPGQSVASLANNNLSWEKNAGLNFGIDFGIFNNRIGGNIEYYQTTTTDLLWDMTLPRMTGFSQIKTNLGEIANSGFEFLLHTRPVQTSNLNWDIDINFATNNNKIVTLLGEDNDGNGIEDDLVASGLFIGRSLGAIYNYKIDGIWQLTDEIPSGFFPGNYRLIDQNNDGKISPEYDRVFLGRTEPAFSLGIRNTINYRDFTLRLFVNSIQGGKDGYMSPVHTAIGQTTGNASKDNYFTFYDYWSPSNPKAKHAVDWVNASAYGTNYQSRSFIRLQDISLSYNLKSSTQKFGLEEAKIYISGKNVLTFTNWDGFDPETGTGLRINQQNFPTIKSYTLGIDISF